MRSAQPASQHRKLSLTPFLFFVLQKPLGHYTAAYRQWLHAPLCEDELTRIRAYMRQEKALGGPRFQEMVSKALNRAVAVRPGGRPRKEAVDRGV